MKFGEIVKSNNWLSVELTLLKLYPDQIESIEAYQEVFDKLQDLDPVDNKIEIVIEQEIDEETQELGMGNVYGIDYSLVNEITNGVALEFTKWDKWLGMKIKKLTQKEFTELEIISHCLYEMTYAGYDEDEIQDEFLTIKGIANDYKSLTPEEKELRTTSLDNLIKKLDEEEE
jgi:hypothetical protein